MDMKKELEISIKDNWYCDQFPTCTDYLSVQCSNFWHRRRMRKIARRTYKAIQSLRKFEILIYRRSQLKYGDSNKFWFCR